MTHEKIFKRKNGTQVKISVWLYVHQNQSNWGYVMFVNESGSDRWFDPFSDKEYLLRVVAPGRIEGLKMDSYEDYVSANEILQAKLELWNMIKPS